MMNGKYNDLPIESQCALIFLDTLIESNLSKFKMTTDLERKTLVDKRATEAAGKHYYGGGRGLYLMDMRLQAKWNVRRARSAKRALLEYRQKQEVAA